MPKYPVPKYGDMKGESARSETISEKYDRYWRSRLESGRSAREARALERARLAEELLAAAGTRSGKLLDVGCGPGVAARYFADLGYKVVAVDVSQVAVGEAAALGVEAHVVDLSRPALPEGPFDVVLVLEVLEHLAEPLQLLLRLKEILAGGGKLVVSLPNEFNAAYRLAILFGFEPFGGYDDPHLHHFGYRSARRLLTEAGLKIEGMRCAGLLPPRLRPFAFLSRCTANVWPSVFALSFVFCTTPHGKPAGRTGR